MADQHQYLPNPWPKVDACDAVIDEGDGRRRTCARKAADPMHVAAACHECASLREALAKAEQESDDRGQALNQLLDDERAAIHALAAERKKREELEGLLREEHCVHPADRHLKMSQQKCHTCHDQWPCAMSLRIDRARASTSPEQPAPED